MADQGMRDCADNHSSDNRIHSEAAAPTASPQGGAGIGGEVSVSPRAGAGGRIRTFLKDELSGWKAWEVAVFCVSVAIIVALSLYWHDTLMGIVSAATGVAYTVCNGKGKRLAYVFGVVNSVLYALISWNAQVYGDALLYGIYYLPAMFVGFVLWGRHMSEETFEVVKRDMTLRGRVLLVLVCTAAVVAGGFILRAVGDAVPFLDSFTTVVSVIALLVALGRYAEQWPLWTAVNAVEVILWTVRLAQGGAAEAGSSLIMWATFLAIGIVMWVKWARELRG